MRQMELNSKLRAFGIDPVPEARINGLDVYIIPTTVERKRTLVERLFQRPWKPFQKTVYVENKGVPKRGEVFRYVDMVLMTQETLDDYFRMMEKEGADV